MKKRAFVILISSMMLSFVIAGCEINKEDEVPVADEAVAVPAQVSTENDTADAIEKDEDTENTITSIKLTDEYLIKVAKDSGVDNPEDSVAIANLKRIKTEVSGLHIDEISDLEQLSCFTGLEELEVYARSTFDIEWVKYLPQIKHLSVNYNSLKDISPLSDLQNLEWLGIEAYGFEDLKPLLSLSKLVALNIKSDSVNDISALAEINSLEYLTLYCSNISTLECDWGALSNINYIDISRLDNVSDYSPIYAINFGDTTFSKNENELEEMYNFVGAPCMYTTAKVSDYRGEYDNEHIPANTYFKCIHLDSESVRSNINHAEAAKYNYDFLKKVDFHLDKYYPCIQYYGQEWEEDYTSTYTNLINDNGDPLKPMATVDEDTHADSSWDNPVVYCDGIYYSFETPLKDMLADNYTYSITGERVSKDKAIEIIDNYVMEGSSERKIDIYKSDEHFGIIEVSPGEKSRYMCDGVVTGFRFYNVQGTSTELPQGNEHARVCTLNLFTMDSLPDSLTDTDIYSASLQKALSFRAGDIRVHFPDFSIVYPKGDMSASQVSIKKNDK